MKKLVLLFLVFFAASTIAAGFDTDKTVYEKQEIIKVSGVCEGTAPTTLTATLEQKEIFSVGVECRPDNSFELEYQTSFLDLSGEWHLALSFEKEVISDTIFVKEKREGGFFLTRFLSPTAGQYQKNQLIVISVEVIDSGQRVADAEVVTWGAKNEKLFFKNNNNGQYVLEYEIPLDAPIGEWKLQVLAQSEKNGEFFGGIGKLDLELVGAPILVNVLGPKVSSFEQGEQIFFDVLVNYSNGNPIQDGKVFLEIGEDIVELEQSTLENFTGIYIVPPDVIGAVELEVKAEDFAQNTGVEKLKIVIGCSFTCLLRQYGLFVATAIVILIALAKIFYSQFNFKGRIKRLKTEKQKLIGLIKGLQKEYFTKGIMPAASYKKNLSDYKSRLLQIDQELSELKRKQDLE